MIIMIVKFVMIAPVKKDFVYCIRIKVPQIPKESCSLTFLSPLNVRLRVISKRTRRFLRTTANRISNFGLEERYCSLPRK